MCSFSRVTRKLQEGQLQSGTVIFIEFLRIFIRRAFEFRVKVLRELRRGFIDYSRMDKALNRFHVSVQIGSFNCLEVLEN